MKLGWMVLWACLLSAGAAPAMAAPSAGGRPSLRDTAASSPAPPFAAWVVGSNDAQAQPFIVVDKIGARAFVFTAQGRLVGDAPVLLGLAKGDRSAPGIGTRALSAISPRERTTPAGRFEAAFGRGLDGKDILWIDYDAAISLHRVITGSPKDHRLQRLATPGPGDNRISFGCINVPVSFYEGVVRPDFQGRGGVVYILPDTETLAAIFPAYDRAEQ